MATTVTDQINGITISESFKAPCVVVTSANITLSGEQTVNGVAVVEGDRVLVIAQTSSVDNGIYDVSTGTWQRAKDFDGNRDVVCGTMVPVNGSSTTAALYQVTTADPIVIGTSAINFSLRYGSTIVYDRTQAEITAGVVPVSTQYPDTNVFRFMTAAQIASVIARDLAQDVTTPLANALLVGRLMFIPNGKYKITSGLIMAAANQGCIFESRSAEIYCATDIDMISMGASFQFLENGTVTGPNTGTTATTAGIRVTNCTRGKISNMQVQYCGYGVRMNGGTSNWVNTVRDCYLFNNSRAGVYGFGHSGLFEGGEIAGSVFGVLQAQLQAGTALLIDRDYASDIGDKITVKNCTIESIGHAATAKAITGAVTAAGQIRLTCPGHGRSTGDYVSINTVVGTVEANGVWPITVIDANHFDLKTSVFANAYVSGGTMYFGAAIYSGVAFAGVRVDNVYMEDVPIGYVAGDSYKNDGTTAHSATVDTGCIMNCTVANAASQSAFVIANQITFMTVIGNQYSGSAGCLINAKGSALTCSITKHTNSGFTRQYEAQGTQVFVGQTIDPLTKNGDIVWQAMVPLSSGSQTLVPAIQVTNHAGSAFCVDFPRPIRVAGITHNSLAEFMAALQADASYANDAAAAGGGKAVTQLYRNGSVVQIRIA